MFGDEKKARSFPFRSVAAYSAVAWRGYEFPATSQSRLQVNSAISKEQHFQPNLNMAGVLSLGPGHKDLARQILDHQAPQYSFAFSPFLLKTYRHGLDPNRPTCKAYLQGHCPLGSACPDKHTSAASTSNYNNLVCKHWLRGLCKKGESCEFLHEYNLRKMPECSFFSRNGYCSNGGMCLSQTSSC